MDHTGTTTEGLNVPPKTRPMSKLQGVIVRVIGETKGFGKYWVTVN